MGSDSKRVKIPKNRNGKRNATPKTTETKRLLLLILCVACLFLAGLFIGYTHFINHPSQPHAKHSYSKLTVSEKIKSAQHVFNEFGNKVNKIMEVEKHVLNEIQNAQTQNQRELSNSNDKNNNNQDANDDDESNQIAKRNMITKMKGKMKKFKSGHIDKYNSKENVDGKVSEGQIRDPVQDTTSLRAHSFRMSGENYIDLKGLTFRDRDALGASYSIAAWFRLEPSNTDIRMKTFFANRVAGCSIHPDRYGFALYANHWQTADRALELDVGDDEKPCHHKSSGPGALKYGKWTHIALIVDVNQDDDTIAYSAYIDKQLKITMQLPHRRNVKSHYPLRVGAHSDNQHGFIGNVSEISVWSHTMRTSNSLSKLLTGDIVLKGDENYLEGLYMLDYHHAIGRKNRKLFKIVKDSSENKKNGVATLPSRLLLGGSRGNGPVNVNADSQFTSKIQVAMGWDASVLASGSYSFDLKNEDLMSELLTLSSGERSNAVKAAMQHCWRNYKLKAWGADEIKPVSGSRSENWGGMGMTLLDSLDSLWLMGLREEFDDATEWVRNNLNFNKNRMVSTFETTIRALGGLNSAYDFSGNQLFLDKAHDLGKRLYKAFSTSSGLPKGQVNLATGHSANAGWTGSAAILSEVGTLQLEFRYLSKATGVKEYGDAATKVFRTIKDRNALKDGLAPIYVSVQTGSFTSNRVTFGALGDSYFEYLLKTWLQGDKKETWLREMYDKAMNGMAAKLLKRSSPSNLAYVGDWDGGRIHHKMDHLVCFLPGILALGAYTKPDSPNAKRDMTLAKAMLYTCYQMYRRTKTGIAPEYVEFPGGRDLQPAGRAPFYILRPETAESMFVLYQITGNPMYQEWAWDMFVAINKYCKTKFGYGAWPDVRQTGRRPDDRMESFWLGETLKYLYLVQTPLSKHGIDLNKYVFNTEAHPTRVFSLYDKKENPQDNTFSGRGGKEAAEEE